MWRANWKGLGGGRRHRQLRAPRRRTWRMRWPRCGNCPTRRGCAGSRPLPAALLLQYTPFEIAERLREYVESRPCAWVFTSATLAIGEDFSHFAARIGLPEARTLRIDSPFDYPATGAHLFAAAHAGSAASGLRRAIHRGLRAAARGQRRPRVSALHQLSRHWRRVSGRFRRASPIRRFRCWYRARRPARRC